MSLWCLFDIGFQRLEVKRVVESQLMSFSLGKMPRVMLDWHWMSDWVSTQLCIKKHWLRIALFRWSDLLEVHLEWPTNQIQSQLPQSIFKNLYRNWNSSMLKGGSNILNYFSSIGMHQECKSSWFWTNRSRDCLTTTNECEWARMQLLMSSMDPLTEELSYFVMWKEKKDYACLYFFFL